MPTITIDDQTVDVPDGATILEAAEKLNIEIPTLCYLKGFQPATSCLVCIVKDRRTGKFVPACATRAVDGMQVDNATDDVSDMRRMALELLLSNHAGDCLAPCFFACPAHMDIPLMLDQIGEHDVREAIKTVKNDIALPAVLGRVCPKPCEKACRRKGMDAPVSICELKRYVADADLATEDPYLPICRPPTGKKVAVVGWGPAGLSASYYLRRYGHECVVYEKQARAGGRLRSEVDSKQLPPAVLDREIEQVLRLGPQVQWETPILDQESLGALGEEFDAVLLTCGAVDSEQIEKWGLTPARRGIAVDRGTYQTDTPGLFAAGNAVRGKGWVVRSVADGKEVARTIDSYLSEDQIEGVSRPFSSKMNRVSEPELAEFMAAADSAGPAEPGEGQEYTSEEAATQANRCLACGCTAHGDCRLERYSIMYNADPNRYSGERHQYEVVNREGNVIFEPGKCIKCELCVKIAASAQEPLGLSFVGRGFDTEVQVPFGNNMDAALRDVAQRCVQHCPTAALRIARDRTVAPCCTEPEA